MCISEPSDWTPLNWSHIRGDDGDDDDGDDDDKEKTEENRKTTDSVRAKKIHKLLRDVNLMHSPTVHFVHTFSPLPLLLQALNLTPCDRHDMTSAEFRTTISVTPNGCVFIMAV